MTVIEPYRRPEEAIGYPLRLEVNGQTYILAQGEHQVIPAAVPQGPVVNGVQHIWTPHGYQPYHAHAAHPPWLRNHYTRGTGILIGAACIGVVLFVAAAALFAVVSWALANLMAIGVTLLMLFVGVMVLLGGLTKARHGHPMRR
jgi:predicted phage tail protein